MNAKNLRNLVGAVAASAAMVAPHWALAAEFLPYEGKNAVREGEGGTKKVVDGIHFWSNGDPPRKYRVLGFVEDTRHKTGLIGMISMSSLESDVASAAKASGGDAVILVAAEAETVGAVGTGFGGARANAFAAGNSVRASGSSWGTGVSGAVQKHHSRYAVVKYLPVEATSDPADDAPPTAAQTAARSD
jgi:hypothetical protein